jgi:hypothetical protein
MASTILDFDKMSNLIIPSNTTSQNLPCLKTWWKSVELLQIYSDFSKSSMADAAILDFDKMSNLMVPFNTTSKKLSCPNIWWKSVEPLKSFIVIFRNPIRHPPSWILTKCQTWWYHSIPCHKIYLAMKFGKNRLNW